MNNMRLRYISGDIGRDIGRDIFGVSQAWTAGQLDSSTARHLPRARVTPNREPPMRKAGKSAHLGKCAQWWCKVQ